MLLYLTVKLLYSSEIDEVVNVGKYTTVLNNTKQYLISTMLWYLLWFDFGNNMSLYGGFQRVWDICYTRINCMLIQRFCFTDVAHYINNEWTYICV